MPYICLSRSDIPDGTVQILDLAPNSSQASAVYDGQGQTRYVNRTKNDAVIVTPLGAMVQNEAEGLRAYLADKVEPGGLEVAGGTITCVAPANADTFTLGGVVFTCVENFATGSIAVLAGGAEAAAVTIAGVEFAAVAADPDPTAQEFLSSADSTPAASATSLAEAINDDDTQTLIIAATGGAGLTAAAVDNDVGLTSNTERGLTGVMATVSTANYPPLAATTTLVLAVAADQEFDGGLSVADDTAVAVTVAAAINNAASVVLVKAANATNYALATPALGVVTLAARDNLAAALPGPTGNLTLISSSAVRLEINDGETIILRMFRTHDTWTVDFITDTAAALQARIDAGSAMTLAAIDVVLLAQAGAELTATGGSNSVGVLTEILSLFAGRIYKLARSTAAGVLNQIMTADNPTYEWNVNVLGGFTEAVTVNGDSWADGEVVPSVLGGATQNREVGNIRHTYSTGAFQISIASGDLFTFADGVTLWPDSDLGPHYPWTYQGAATATVTGARVVTVYDDSGNVLA